ncbi:MAG: hypothetical protein RL077_3436, partial [Verrucomicrobiota bacterium]
SELAREVALDWLPIQLWSGFR